MQHRNAGLTPTGRLDLVKLVVDGGKTFEEAAASSKVRSKGTTPEAIQRVGDPGDSSLVPGPRRNLQDPDRGRC